MGAVVATIGGLLVIGVLLAFALIWRRRRAQRDSNIAPNKEADSSIEMKKVESVSAYESFTTNTFNPPKSNNTNNTPNNNNNKPTTTTATITSPIQSNYHNQNASRIGSTVDSKHGSLASRLEIPFESLTFEKSIGTGMQVYLLSSFIPNDMI